MRQTPDVLGMEAAEAAELLEAAGISYKTEMTAPAKPRPMRPYAGASGKGADITDEDGSSHLMVDRVVRQITDRDGIVRLTICRIDEPCFKLK